MYLKIRQSLPESSQSNRHDSKGKMNGEGRGKQVLEQLPTPLLGEGWARLASPLSLARMTSRTDLFILGPSTFDLWGRDDIGKRMKRGIEGLQ